MTLALDVVFDHPRDPQSSAQLLCDALRDGRKQGYIPYIMSRRVQHTGSLQHRWLGGRPGVPSSLEQRRAETYRPRFGYSAAMGCPIEATRSQIALGVEAGLTPSRGGRFGRYSNQDQARLYPALQWQLEEASLCFEALRYILATRAWGQGRELASSIATYNAVPRRGSRHMVHLRQHRM